MTTIPPILIFFSTFIKYATSFHVAGISGVVVSSRSLQPFRNCAGKRIRSGSGSNTCTFFSFNDQQQQKQEEEQEQRKSREDDWLTASLDGFEPAVIGPKHVLVYDTTLRDGTQGESVSASCDDKLKITRRLAQFDMDYIEAGWPGSNPKDAEFFDRAKTELTESEKSKLTAFGSTRRKRTNAKDDAQVHALVDSEAPSICLVAKSHSWQVEEILKTTKEENLNMINDTVQYLVEEHGRRVFVDLEHFFDGFKADPVYALKCAESAAGAGATALVLCDTNGGSMPWEVAAITKQCVRHFNNLVTVGIHAHNDCGMAVANSLSALNSGAGMVQGTINGIGERTGNADLCSIVPSLAFHVQSKYPDDEVGILCKKNLQEMTKLSRFVDEILNRTPNNAQPFVGLSAFAHKGGLHVAAMERNPLSYQHIHPELVGNEKRVLVSELSGRQNIMGAIESVDGLLSDSNNNFDNVDDDESKKSAQAQQQRALGILNRVKKLENQGYTFEGAEASVHLMILHSSKEYCPPFRVLDYSAHVYDHDMDSVSRVITRMSKDENDIENYSTAGPTARATVKVRTINIHHDNDDDDTSRSAFYINDSNIKKKDNIFRDQLEVSDGNGPVDALAKALIRALQPTYPSVSNVELVDYKVRILDPKSATAAATRVMIEFRDKETKKKWTTVSVDRNVISASLNALIDGLEYALIKPSSAMSEHACMLD